MTMVSMYSCVCFVKNKLQIKKNKPTKLFICKDVLILDVTVIVSEDDDNIVRCDDQIVTKMKPEFLNSPLIQVMQIMYVMFMIIRIDQ